MQQVRSIDHVSLLNGPLICKYVQVHRRKHVAGQGYARSVSQHIQVDVGRFPHNAGVVRREVAGMLECTAGNFQQDTTVRQSRRQDLTYGLFVPFC